MRYLVLALSLSMIAQGCSQFRRLTEGEEKDPPMAWVRTQVRNVTISSDYMPVTDGRFERAGKIEVHAHRQYNVRYEDRLEVPEQSSISHCAHWTKSGNTVYVWNAKSDLQDYYLLEIESFEWKRSDVY